MSLYEAINRRRSIRNYDVKGLSKTRLDELEQQLNRTRKFQLGVSLGSQLVRDGRALQQEISGIIADYGKVEAPHYLVLTSEGTEKGYVELGYRYELVVLTLAAQDIGTCWIGKGFRDQQLRQHVRIPSDQSCTSLIALGPLPEGDDLYDIEEPKRKDLAHFLVNQTPECLDEEIRRTIDCLRRAPSSLNSQPWRVVVEEGTIHLYLNTRSKITKIMVRNMHQMNFVDAGIGLCHLEVGGEHFREGCEVGKIPHPEQKGLTYIGSLSE